MSENQTPREKPDNFTELVERFRFKWERDSIGEPRSTLLIVTALIVTVTFQAGINPPPLLFDKSNNSSSSTGAIVAFSVANSIAFSASTAIVEYLTVGFPFHRELIIAFFSMGASYGLAIANTGLIGTAQIYVVLFSLFLPQLLRWVPALMMKIGCR